MRRKSSRWYPGPYAKGAFFCGGLQEKLKIVDVGSDGMRVHFFRPVAVGTELCGTLELPHVIMDKPVPFYVKGEVTQVKEGEGVWDAGVEFSEVTFSPVTEHV